MRPFIVTLLLVLPLAACAEPGPLQIGTGDEPDVAPSCAELRAADEADVDGPLADDDEVADAQQARAGYALDSDEETVREVLETTDEDDWAFGFPHTSEEREELTTRGDHGDTPSELRGWAEREAPDAFAGVWVEQAEGAALYVAFTEDLDAYEEEVAERFGEDIRVVEADHTHQELRAIQGQITERMQEQHEAGADQAPGAIVGTGSGERENRVSVDILDGDEETVADLSREFGADRICVNVLDPPEGPAPDGPVRPLAKVEGWRDGLDPHADPFALLEVAWDRETAETAWANNVPDDLEAGAPDEGEPGRYDDLDAVDFDDEALLVWSSGESGSCPGWLADVATDGDGDLEVTRDSFGAGACTDDYNPYRMVLAVDRDRLPDPEALPGELVGDVPDGVADAYPFDG
ncbi:hypothetical protein ER308_18155 [Egibacter rhizosphaerae]|uniref:Uncharacterized protein n=1 Tax=Egibacter rhizosphaerae TaxID=1670831 RepID=A0A411YJB6_9ACTN|nr:hypothetical protein [Egibacter rhizosphaerae]QBI21303.1 hypothetical protein ER308_18155 [Egibacter rhizosphaerae]